MLNNINLSTGRSDIRHIQYFDMVYERPRKREKSVWIKSAKTGYQRLKNSLRSTVDKSKGDLFSLVLNVLKRFLRSSQAACDVKMGKILN